VVVVTIYVNSLGVLGVVLAIVGVVLVLVGWLMRRHRSTGG
jgi:hypothetical protein